MDKYESKARRILARIDTQLGSFKLIKGSDEWGDSYRPYWGDEQEYRDILLDMQMLFYEYDPQMPLYAESLALNKRVRLVEDRLGEYGFGHSHFAKLKYLIKKYLQVLAFRQEP